jgi:hypothetical protein
MFRALALAIITFFTFSAYGARPMVVYYESWSADSAANDIIELPEFVTHLMISFVKPEASYNGNLNLSDTGLNLPYSGETLKNAVKMAKQNNPSLHVLLAVGGATYHHWELLNANALVALVNDLGLDGIDIDYEAPQPNGDLVNQVTAQLRNALPDDKELTMAVMHVAAYGRDEWTHSQPTGSVWTGFLHEILPALENINMINVMSYDAGSSYDVMEAYEAFDFYYHDVIAMGMQVPPEAWGEHVWTVDKVESVAALLLKNQTDGFMLWSMHKDNEHVSDTNPDFPSANLLATTACNSLSLTEPTICTKPIHADKNSTLTFRNDSNENGVYFLVNAMPYGYPRTDYLNVGEEDILTGIDIPITTNALPIFVYVESVGYETQCTTIDWAPQNMTWKLNFWLDDAGKPWCSAGPTATFFN